MTRPPNITALVAVLAVIAGHASAQVDSQRPLKDVEQVVENPNDRVPAVEHPALDARVNIMNKPKYSCSRDRDTPYKELDIPVDTCVSANFTLDYNVHIAYPGLCPGGTRAPYLAFYNKFKCAGSQVHPTWYDGGGGMGPGHCVGPALWAKTSMVMPENEWSMVFSCQGLQPDSPAETEKMMDIYLPQPKPKKEPKPQPRPSSASTSDSACWIDGDSIPRFIFQKPEADVCVNVAAKHRLRIYRNALCPNGTEAMFARFSSVGCTGEPISLQEVTEDIMSGNSNTPCINMGGDKASSYAFWCSGELLKEKVREGLFPDDDEGVTRIHYEFGNVNRVSTKSDAGVLGVSLSFAWLVAVCVLAF